MLKLLYKQRIGYYEGEENTAWLQGNSSSSTIITDGKGLVPTGMFIWPIPGYTRITSHFRHENTPYYSVHINYIVVLMYGAPLGANFVAMSNGTVIKATYNSAYGNMVMIDHSNGIVTLYAHR